MTVQSARVRIQIEYIEMPDLKLSEAQIRRLCDLSEDICKEALGALLATGFLVKSRTGTFLRGGLAPQAL